MTQMCDLLVIGAGPAGLSAATFAASEGLTTRVISGDKIGGQARQSSAIENYMGFPVGLTGDDLIERAYAQAVRFGVSFTHENARRIRPSYELGDRSKNYFTVFTPEDEFEGRAVILATGVVEKHLRIPNDGSIDLVYGGQIDPELPRDHKVGVIGGGNSAGQAAVKLAAMHDKVYLFVRRTLADTMSSYLVSKIGATRNILVRIGEPDKILAGHLVIPGNSVEIFTLYVFIGAVPNTDWSHGVGVNEDGYIITLASGPFHTSRPGIFAIGDVREGSIHRVASAAGEGAAVITEVHRWIAQ